MPQLAMDAMAASAAHRPSGAEAARRNNPGRLSASSKASATRKRVASKRPTMFGAVNISPAVAWSFSRRMPRASTSSGNSQASSRAVAMPLSDAKACTPSRTSAASHHQMRRWRSTIFNSATTSMPSAPRAKGSSRRSSQRSFRPACDPARALATPRAAAQSSKGAAASTPAMANSSHSSRPNMSGQRGCQAFHSKRVAGLPRIEMPTLNPKPCVSPVAILRSRWKSRAATIMPLGSLPQP